MNSSQVRGKARAAMNRRAEEIEDEEIMSGEINLVPYLDMVTNLMLFLLASVSSGFILGQIDTTLPDHAAASSKASVDPKKSPDEQSLQIIVSITKTHIALWSVSGLEGTLKDPKVTASLLAPVKASDPPTFDYPKLNAALLEIATRRWAGKLRPTSTYEILLQADGDIPYETVIAVMDNVRRPMPDVKPLPIVTMPKFEVKDGKDIPIENYDPAKHLLFADVIFAKSGFE